MSLSKSHTKAPVPLCECIGDRVGVSEVKGDREDGLEPHRRGRETGAGSLCPGTLQKG
jgi:hypothetical protein